MLKTSRRKGFTLVEIMVVVTLIGLLTVSAVPLFQRIKLRAVSATFVSDMRLIEEAFQRYAQEYGEFPRTAGVGVVPTGMEEYIDAERWAGATTLGGNYRWLGEDQYSVVMIVGSTISMREMQLIDEWIDDGNTNSGNLIVAGAGTVVYYILELRT